MIASMTLEPGSLEVKFNMHLLVAYPAEPPHISLKSSRQRTFDLCADVRFRKHSCEKQAAGLLEWV